MHRKHSTKRLDVRSATAKLKPEISPIARSHVEKRQNMERGQIHRDIIAFLACSHHPQRYAETNLCSQLQRMPLCKELFGSHRQPVTTFHWQRYQLAGDGKGAEDLTRTILTSVLEYQRCAEKESRVGPDFSAIRAPRWRTVVQLWCVRVEGARPLWGDSTKPPGADLASAFTTGSWLRIITGPLTVLD